MIISRILLLISLLRIGILPAADQDIVHVKATLKTGPPSLKNLAVKKIFQMFDPSSSLTSVDLLHGIAARNIIPDIQEYIKDLIITDPFPYQEPDRTGVCGHLNAITSSLPPHTFDHGTKMSYIKMSPDKNYSYYIAIAECDNKEIIESHIPYSQTPVLAGKIVLLDHTKKTAKTIIHPGIICSQYAGYSTYPAFSKDGTALFFKDARPNNETLYCYTIDDDILKEHTKAPDIMTWQKILITSDRKSILFQKMTEVVTHLFDVDKGTLINLPGSEPQLSNRSTHFITRSFDSDDDNSDDDNSEDSENNVHQIFCYSIDGKQLFSRACDKYAQTFFDKTGSQLITMHNRRVSIWTVETGELLKQIEYPEYIGRDVSVTRLPYSNKKLLTIIDLFNPLDHNSFLITDTETGQYVHLKMPSDREEQKTVIKKNWYTVSEGFCESLFSSGFFENPKQYYNHLSFTTATVPDIFKLLLAERYYREKKEIPCELISDLKKSTSQCVQDLVKYRYKLTIDFIEVARKHIDLYKKSFKLEQALRFKNDKKDSWLKPSGKTD